MLYNSCMDNRERDQLYDELMEAVAILRKGRLSSVERAYARRLCMMVAERIVPRAANGERLSEAVKRVTGGPA